MSRKEHVPNGVPLRNLLPKRRKPTPHRVETGKERVIILVRKEGLEREKRLGYVSVHTSLRLTDPALYIRLSRPNGLRKPPLPSVKKTSDVGKREQSLRKRLRNGLMPYPSSGRKGRDHPDAPLHECKGFSRKQVPEVTAEKTENFSRTPRPAPVGDPKSALFEQKTFVHGKIDVRGDMLRRVTNPPENPDGMRNAIPGFIGIPGPFQKAPPWLTQDDATQFQMTGIHRFTLPNVFVKSPVRGKIRVAMVAASGAAVNDVRVFSGLKKRADSDTMEDMKQSDRTSREYLLAASGAAVFGLFLSLSAIGGFFFRPVVATAAALLGGTSLLLGGKSLLRDTLAAKAVFTLAVAVAVAVLVGTEPFLFSGRDQGSIAEAAIGLAGTGDIRFSYPVTETFFGIYGPGKALNFPGFHYTDDGRLVTQFPLGTVAAYGAAVSVGGAGGLIAINGLLLVTSLFGIFLITRELAGGRLAVLSVVTASVSFLPLWSARLTLSENIFLPVFLITSFALIRFLDRADRVSFAAAFLSSALLAFIRIEGLFAFAATLAVLAFSASGRRFAHGNTIRFRVLPGLVASALAAAAVLSNAPLYRSVLKALIGDRLSAAGTEIPSPAASAFPVIDLWQIFLGYGLFLPFLLGLAGIAILVFRKDLRALIPAFLALPAFLFLADPNITPDHPWMLRRFLFSLWPTFFIIVPAALRELIPAPGRRGKGLIAPAIFLSIVLLSVPATSALLRTEEYAGLDGTTDEIAVSVGDDDLLLVDRETVGDPFAIPAGPLRFLYGKNAVYFFNPSDYEKIGKENYAGIYLLAPADAVTRWDGTPARPVPVAEIPFSYVRTERLPIGDASLPRAETVSGTATLFRIDPL